MVNFSAVAYFFGREIHKTLNVPVGLIAASQGTTQIELWTAPEGLTDVPSLQSSIPGIEAAANSAHGKCDACRGWPYCGPRYKSVKLKANSSASVLTMGAAAW